MANDKQTIRPKPKAKKEKLNPEWKSKAKLNSKTKQQLSVTQQDTLL